jgi:peptide deformylase
MAKILPIKIYPCPVLRRKTRALKTQELQRKEIKQLFLDMAKTMKEKDGVGLAAPQVGQDFKIVVINTKDGDVILINPKILRKSWKKELLEEGCLSLPEIFGLVKRSQKISLTALNQDGKKIKFKAEGMFARVIQHEVDHLNGVLFIDRAKEITQGKEKLEKINQELKIRS